MRSQLHRPLVGFVAGVGLAIAVSAMAQDAAQPATSSSTTKTIIKDATSSNEAAVDPTGRLQTQQAAPASFFHQSTFDIAACVRILRAPAKKAVVVTEIGIDTFVDATPGESNNVEIFTDAGCTVVVADVNPGAVGLTTATFGPGLVATALYAEANSGVEAETYVNGYTIPSSEAPVAAVQPATPRLRNTGRRHR